MSHSCGWKRKPKLLVVNDLRVDPFRRQVPDRDIRAFGGLEQHFDVTWTVTRGTDHRARARLPDDVGLVFLPPIRSKWHYFLLLPKYVRVFSKAMRAHDIALVPAPMLETIPALIAARYSRRPAVLMVLAPMSALRFFQGGLGLRIAPIILNLEVLLSTETLIHGSPIARHILPPLRKRLDFVMFSTLGDEDFIHLRERSRGGGVDLLCVARLVPEKRIDVAISAVARLRSDELSVSLTVVGDGVERPRLEQLAGELGVSDVVRFVGWIDDRLQLRELYRRGFALLLPSEFEGFSLAVLEAMAAGTPVVTTAPGEMSRLLEHGSNALIVSSPSAELFAAAVHRLYEDRDLRLNIARAAQRRAWSFTRDAWQTSFCERARRLIMPSLH